MKIAVIGATGMAGQAVFEEATKRGHAVTAIVRDADKAREKLGADATILVGDLFEMHADVFEEFDVVVNAFANHKDAYLNLDALTHLLHEFRRLQTAELVQQVCQRIQVQVSILVVSKGIDHYIEFFENIGMHLKQVTYQNRRICT